MLKRWTFFYKYEYTLFINKDIYKEENMNDILPIIATAGKELFLRNKENR